MTIKRKLTFFFIVSITFVMLVSSIVYYAYIQSVLISNNDRQMNQIAEMGSIAFENFFEARRQELSYLSENGQIQDTLWMYLAKQEMDPGSQPSYDQLNRYFEDLVEDNQDLQHAFILGLDGRVVASDVPESYYIDLSDRQYFKDALRGEFTISNLLQDRVENENVLFAAAPVVDNSGTTIGVIATIINKSAVAMSLSRMVDEQEGQAHLMDQEARVVFHVNEERIATIHEVEGYQDFYTDPYRITYETVHQTNRGLVYMTAHKINGTPWVLVVEQDRSILLDKSQQALLFMFFANLALLMLAIYLSFKLASWVTRPLCELTDVVKKTSAGDLSIRSKHVSKDELGILSQNLNDMLDELVGAYEEVESKNAELVETYSEVEAKNEELIAIEEELRENNEALEKSQLQIERVAFTHPLSGLPNRLEFELDIKSLIEKEALERKPFSVYQMDIDNFMRVNDSLGHRFGDEVLKAIASRLKNMSTSHLTLYHLSADEFAFIDQKNHDEMSINTIMEDIYSAFGQPFEVNDRTLYLSMSTGISTYPNDGDVADTIVQNADTAMFNAKKNGRATWYFYKKIMSDAVRSRIEIEDLLREAIEKKYVYFELQPQVPTTLEDKVCFEALMRMKGEAGQSVSPGHFIPIAEESGQIVALGYWILESVAGVVKDWRDRQMSFGHISVNVSTIQLKQADFIERVQAILDNYEIEAGDIELEMTESVMVDLNNQDNHVIEQLKALGFSIALDDFGTGYSSFSYLTNLPVSTLKIDKAFIDNITTSKKDDDLVRQMIDIAHDLQLKTVAEGVEDENQASILAQYGCDYIQGFYYSKPVSVQMAEIHLPR